MLEKAGLRLVRSFRFTIADLEAAGTYQVESAELWDGDDVEYALDWEECARQSQAVGEQPWLAGSVPGL